jgi:hypothetical protein
VPVRPTYHGRVRHRILLIGQWFFLKVEALTHGQAYAGGVLCFGAERLLTERGP